jgi:exonuclease SbcC
MGLEVYFMAAELESVLEAANLRLKTLSRGRFSLMHTDQGVGRANTQAGLGIEVMDENTGKPFDPHRFSGGETFLASLSLALGLAEVVTSRNGGIKIDTLFVDEGFGSLSGEALEDAMSILESLKSGGRTVGLISHVESMKERIPTQLKVNKTPNGPSTISV